ncbi:tape measure protein [Actinacidiphila oryziradicis]|uniref:tape measure protein n=1 Tax=Actinacidiphila oryziradicis TaxID=2571141 RepID=UPI0023F2324D|nr:tape measure protein [Actinacidiphila oryziradicis]MCW2872561.1 hypothetical protein [Actinacidiphila oryziradicis]
MAGSDTRRVQFDFIGRDQVTPVMNRVGQSAEGLHGKMGKLAGAIGGKLAMAAKGGALALGAVASSAVVFGVKTAAGMEQSKVAFTTMLGSASKAQKMLGDLQKFAANTPFEFTDVTRASQRLMAMGFTAKQVIPTLTAIGDAVAGLGGGAEQVDQVTTAIGQMMAKGKIQSDELLQLTEAGIPALKILAAGYHVTAGKMQEMVTKGDVLSSKALPLLLTGIEKGTKGTQKFGGMMAAQSKTLSGMFSNLKDNVSQALGNMITPFMPALKTGLKELVDLTGKLGNAFQTKAVPAIKDFFKEFKKGFDGASKQKPIKLGRMVAPADMADVKKSQTTAEKFGSALRKVGDWIKKYVTPALKDLGHWLKDVLAPALKKFSDRWLKDATKAFGDVKKAINDNHKPLKSLGDFLGKAATMITKYVIPALGVLQGSTLIGVGKAIKYTIAFIVSWWKTMQFLGKTVFAVGNAVVKTFLFMAGSVIHSAAKAFGWMPGIGPKLKAADKEFQGFAKKVNAAIASITKGKTVNISVKAAGTWAQAGSGTQHAKELVHGFFGGRVPATHPGASRSQDSVPAMLRVDEHVLTPEEVDGAGGHGAVFRMRKLMRAGKLRGFAAGGPVGVNPQMSTPSAGQMKSSVWKPINTGYEKLIAAVATALAKTGGGAMGVVAAARRMIGYPYSWGGGGAGGPSYGIGRGAGTYGFDCSGLSEYAWWQGAHKHIGGVTNSQWANSRPISGPRPGALAFPSGPGVHVMIGSDKPGYVIQAPYTGSFVQEVPRTSGNWRWPFATGGAVQRHMSNWGKASTGNTWGKATVGKPKAAAALKYGWTAATEAADAWQQVWSAGGPAWIRQRDPLTANPWGGGGIRRAGWGWGKGSTKDPWNKATYSPWSKSVKQLGDGFSHGSLTGSQVALVQAAMIAGGAPVRARARGGPVYPGMSYLVGERGPEIMSQRTPGTIHPHGTGVGTTVNLNVIVQGHALATKRQIADEVLSALRVAKKQGVNVRVV